MLRALARGARAGDTLTIYGDGPDRAELSPRGPSRPGGAASTSPGHMPDAASQLPGFDTLLLSSRYEGVPAVLIEALAAGSRSSRPTAVSGVRSVLGDGRFGAIVRRDEAALATGRSRIWTPFLHAAHAGRHAHLHYCFDDRTVRRNLSRHLPGRRPRRRVSSAPSKIDELIAQFRQPDERARRSGSHASPRDQPRPRMAADDRRPGPGPWPSCSPCWCSLAGSTLRASPPRLQSWFWLCFALFCALGPTMEWLILHRLWK